MSGLNGLKSQYERDGFVTAPSLIRAETIQRLRDEVAAIVGGERGEILGLDLVREAAGDGGDMLPHVLAIHYPHKISELMRETMLDSAILEVLRALIGPDVKCMQSMLFVKNAGKPGQAWHQDEHYIPTRDRSLVGVWIALEQASVENGCLWMHPGSHRRGVLYRTAPHSDPRFDYSEEAQIEPLDREGGVPVELEAGGVAFFNGYVLHRSLNNRTNGSRRALVYHYMSAQSLLPWALGKPPKPRNDFRDFELVCGSDPYEWKGKEEILYPFVRPESVAGAQIVHARRAERDRT
jgi:phytanoyl-CoA hydroxylase